MYTSECINIAINSDVTRKFTLGRLKPLPFHSLPTSSSLPSPLPLEVGPQMQLGGLGSAVSSPSGVWGGAPAEIEFGAF